MILKSDKGPAFVGYYFKKINDENTLLICNILLNESQEKLEKKSI